MTVFSLDIRCAIKAASLQCLLPRLVVFVLCLGAVVCEADEAPRDPECPGFWYRAKRNGVVLYQDPDAESFKVGELTVGERVCVVGEQRKFAIVDLGYGTWTMHRWVREPSLEKRGKSDTSKADKGFEKNPFDYCRAQELWPPSDAPKQFEPNALGWFKRMKQYYHFLRSGGVPEEGILPVSPFVEEVMGKRDIRKLPVDEELLEEDSRQERE